MVTKEQCRPIGGAKVRSCAKGREVARTKRKEDFPAATSALPVQRRTDGEDEVMGRGATRVPALSRRRESNLESRISNLTNAPCCAGGAGAATLSACVAACRGRWFKAHEARGRGQQVRPAHIDPPMKPDSSSCRTDRLQPPIRDAARAWSAGLVAVARFATATSRVCCRGCEGGNSVMGWSRMNLCIPRLLRSVLDRRCWNECETRNSFPVQGCST